MKLTVIELIFGDVMGFVGKMLRIMVMWRDQWIVNRNLLIVGGNSIKDIVVDNF